MAKKRKATRKKRPNPAAPKFPINRMVKVRGVRVNPKGVVTAVIMEDRHMGQLKAGKRK
jgi:hypothetical protein